MRKNVYNLEFPPWCPELKLHDYEFTRVENYETQVQKLHHLVTGHAEFTTRANAGTHAVTAYVDTPEQEIKAALPWFDETASALLDILFLLSLFTGREVFTIERSLSDMLLDDLHGSADMSITADPRVHQWGGSLRCSIPYEKKSTGIDFSKIDGADFFEIVDTEDGEEWIPYDPPVDPSGYNIGFEKGLNRIYELISSPTWQERYNGGYFLFLARSAFRRQTIEASFIQCWTIWEHLFSVLNHGKLSDETIQNRIRAEDKVGYLLIEFDLMPRVDHKKLKPLVEVRNRLVHVGRFPARKTPEATTGDRHNAELFIRLTECILARILNLTPSDIFETREKLDKFIVG